MRFSLPILFAASLVSALTVLERQDTVPACAATCSSTAAFNPCAGNDIACLCVNQNYLAQLNNCIQTTCSAEDQATAVAIGNADCKAAGIDFDNLVPACATACSQSPATACAANNGGCMCSDQQYVQTIWSCYKGVCSGQDLETVRTVAEAECRALGVDISSTLA